MYPEVEQFIAAREAALTIRRETPSKNWEERHDPETCRYCVFDATEAAAFAVLAESADPLVRWIAKSCKNYASEAIKVLEVLPTDMDTLDALADRQGWCGDWEDFRAAAKEDGVLPTTEKAEVSA